jgi:hypothetical protein
VRTDEELLVRFDPLRMLVRKLLQQVEGAHNDQRIVVVGKRRELGDERWVLLDG